MDGPEEAVRCQFVTITAREQLEHLPLLDGAQREVGAVAGIKWETVDAAAGGLEVLRADRRRLAVISEDKDTVLIVVIVVETKNAVRYVTNNSTVCFLARP